MEKLLKALYEKELNVVKELLENGLAVNYRESIYAHRTPAFYAAKYDFAEALNELLERGADINSFDDRRVTPLHAAAGHGSLNSLIRLLEAGADPNAKDIHGKTPLHFATRALMEIDEEKGFQIVQILLNVGAIPSIKDEEDRTPLHEASFVGNVDVLSLLLSGKRTPLMHERDKDGKTPLHLAVLGSRSIEAVKFLLQFNPFIDAKDIDGRTPLHYVAERTINYVDKNFDVDCLALLLASGASAHVKDNDGCNALSLALHRTIRWNGEPIKDSVLYSVQLLIAKGSAIIDGFDMWRIVETFPSFVMVALNQSIKVNTSAKDSLHFKLEFDFRPLVVSTKLLTEKKRKRKSISSMEAQLLPPTLLNYNEISMLYYIFQEGHKDILRHPLCSAFLHLKWLRVRKFFILHIILYFIFVSIFTTYIINLQDSSNREGENNISKNSTFTNESSPMNFNASMKNGLCNILRCFTIVFIIKDIFHIVHSPSIYIRRYENYIDILVIICILILFNLPEHGFPITQRNISTVAIISSWIRLMLFLKGFPSYGVYVEMFSTVCNTVFHFLAVYLPLLIGFALGFSVLLGELKFFKMFPTSFVTTLIMMTGEIDYEEKFLRGSNLSFFSFLVLIVFLFLVYIILSNLLVALAVNDLNAIYKKSETLRLSRQVQLLATLESFLKSPLIPHCLRKYLERKFSMFQGYSGGSIAILPNKKHGFVENLYLKLLFIFRWRWLLTKIFEQFTVNFMPPAVNPSLPNILIQEAIQIALTEFEIKNREKMQFAKTHQFDTMRQCTSPKEQRKLNIENASGVYPQPKKGSFISQQNFRNFNPINKDADTDPYSFHNGFCTESFQQRPSIKASILRARINNEMFRNVHDTISDSRQELNSDMEDLRSMVSILKNTAEKLTQKYPSLKSEDQIKVRSYSFYKQKLPISPVVKQFPNIHDVDRDAGVRKTNIQELSPEIEDLRGILFILKRTIEKLTQKCPSFKSGEPFKNGSSSFSKPKLPISPLVTSCTNNHDLNSDSDRRVDLSNETLIQNLEPQVNVESSNLKSTSNLHLM